MFTMKDKYVKTIQDSEGNLIVVIDNILFSGKRRIDWEKSGNLLRSIHR